MPLTNPPAKPFPNYKWRWAVLTPTESLNEPPIFLGVLRVFDRYQNFRPSSQEIMNGLAIVQSETNAPVNLARSTDRNLVRNSGQYWKALGLLEEASGRIVVTPFGQMLAKGEITQVEFATTIIKTLTLPNGRIQNQIEINQWNNAGLQIKPLQLILEILSQLQKISFAQKYITPFELVKIIIPLAGAKALPAVHAKAIVEFRNGQIDITQWPDCAPAANDRRMAREFLLFLTNYGFLRCIKEVINDNDQYYLSSISLDEIADLDNLIVAPQQNLNTVVRQLRITQIPANIERKRISREVLERPYQAVFRRNILTTYNSTCLITNVTIESVLEAAHIKPVQYEGSDGVDNGLCLRSDIHQLFDSNQLKILPNGQVVLSAAAQSRNNYHALTRQIQLPESVNLDYLNWRSKYY